MASGRGSDGQEARPPPITQVVAEAQEVIEEAVERAKEELREVTERLQERAEP